MREEQISQTNALIESMEAEAERNVAMVQDLEENQSFALRQEMQELRADTNM